MKRALFLSILILSGCGGGGSTSPPADPTAPPTPSTAHDARLTFIGDSWFAGTGVATSCYPRPTMDSSPCPSGQSIADDIARALHAAAYQNLALGGSTLYDALKHQALKVDPSAQVVVVMSGYNDEKPMGDDEAQWNTWNACDPATRTYFPDIYGNSSCPVAEPWTASTYSPSGFTETPNDPAVRVSGVLSEVEKAAPGARVVFVVPAHDYQIPETMFTPQQIATYQWSNGIIDSAITSQPAQSIDLGDAQIYAAGNFVPQGQCPTPGVGNCGAHPNATGAQVIAQFIVNALP